MGHGMHSSGQFEIDECASYGKDQRWAFVWLVLVLILAPMFVSFLSGIDSWLYHNDDLVDIAGVKLLDDDKYRENREASSSLASESSDPREAGSYTQAVSR